jgi:hypothetical protein
VAVGSNLLGVAASMHSSGGFGGGGKFPSDRNDRRLEQFVWASGSEKCRLGKKEEGRWAYTSGLKGAFSPGWWLQPGLKG